MSISGMLHGRRQRVYLDLGQEGKGETNENVCDSLPGALC